MDFKRVIPRLVGSSILKSAIALEQQNMKNITNRIVIFRKHDVIAFSQQRGCKNKCWRSQRAWGSQRNTHPKHGKHNCGVCKPSSLRTQKSTSSTRISVKSEILKSQKDPFFIRWVADMQKPASMFQCCPNHRFEHVVSTIGGSKLLERTWKQMNGLKPHAAIPFHCFCMCYRKRISRKGNERAQMSPPVPYKNNHSYKD